MVTEKTRFVDPILIEQLDSLEKIVAREFVKEGKWELVKKTKNELNEEGCGK